MTVILDEAAEAGIARADLIAGLFELVAWLEMHPGTPLPRVRATFPVPRGDRGQQVGDLREVADALRVPVDEDGQGNLLAERMFGPIPAGAGLAHPDGSTNGWLLRAGAKAATPGSPEDETAALTARLAEWIGAERITGNYPASVIAAILAETISGEYLAASLDKGGTPYLRDAARRVKHYADTTPDEDKAEARLAGVRA